MQVDIIKEIADRADMIVSGYAYTNEDGRVRITNLHRPDHVAVICDGKIVETTMDDIEQVIVMEYYEDNRRFMED